MRSAPLAPQLLDALDVVASPDFRRWERAVRRCGHCSRPVRLRGHVISGNRVVYSTADEPGRVLLKACGNRRAAVCPSCSYVYAGDTWQLLYAGIAGGRKGVPATVAHHPMAFVTLTAPSFGIVHRGSDAPCRPRRSHPRCPHGMAMWCTKRHHDDSAVGTPFCDECYDYVGAVLFNWRAPELWRRFVIALPRELARRCGMTSAEFQRRVRVSFAKVAEFQRRGVVHVHAIVRLDDRADVALMPAPVGQEELELAVRDAAARVHVEVDGGGRTVDLSWGDQIDVRTIAHGEVEGNERPSSVAAYIAKYATKASEDFGIGGRPLSSAAARHAGASDHTVRTIATIERLATSSAECTGILRWSHMLGFRGHFSTRSRRYSVTLGELRRARVEFQRRASGAEVDEPSNLVVAHWRFTGIGYRSAGEAFLAAAAEGRAREWRALAREAEMFAARSTNDERS
ncbi:MAG: replication initiator [Desertimonas sp.]